jgi:hypothetical protein
MCLINAYVIKRMGQQKTAPPTLNFDITCRCVVSCMSLLFQWTTELLRTWREDGPKQENGNGKVHLITGHEGPEVE